MPEHRRPTAAHGPLATLLQFIRYGQASALSASLTLGLPILLVELAAVDPDVAAAIGLASAYVVNFFTLRAYVYRSRGEMRRQAVRFLLISLAMRLGEYTVYYALHNFLGVHYGVALAAILLVSAISKFFFYKKLVFT